MGSGQEFTKKQVKYQTSPKNMSCGWNKKNRNSRQYGGITYYMELSGNMVEWWSRLSDLCQFNVSGIFWDTTADMINLEAPKLCEDCEAPGGPQKSGKSVRICPERLHFYWGSSGSVPFWIGRLVLAPPPQSTSGGSSRAHREWPHHPITFPKYSKRKTTNMPNWNNHESPVN